MTSTARKLLMLPTLMLRVWLCVALIFGSLASQVLAADFRINSSDHQGNITWANAYSCGVCTVEAATALTNRGGLVWGFQQNYFTTNSTGHGQLLLGSS